MINEDALRDTLLALTNELKSSWALIASLMNEIEALRDTVHALDPTFEETLQQNRRRMLQKYPEAASELSAGCKAIFQRVKDGYVC